MCFDNGADNVALNSGGGGGEVQLSYMTNEIDGLVSGYIMSK